MHEHDFRDDLAPTRGQYRAIALEFLRLAGEPAPESRAAATELILRLEESPTPNDAASAAAAAAAGLCLAPVTRSRATAVSPPAVSVPRQLGPELLRDAYNQLRDRADRRARRGGYNAGWRCWGCRRFVSGPHATCEHCGQRHGGAHHEAYATR